jgi:hypothetical protein
MLSRRHPIRFRPHWVENGFAVCPLNTRCINGELLDCEPSAQLRGAFSTLKAGAGAQGRGQARLENSLTN